jgi:hypothetical protein
VTYTPNLGYFGSDSFTFTINDGNLTSEPGIVLIYVINISFTLDTDGVPDWDE